MRKPSIDANRDSSRAAILRSARLIETTRAMSREYLKTREDTLALLDRAEHICRSTRGLVRATNALIARCCASLRPSARPKR